MEILRSDIVKSTAGRDKGKLFFVLDTEELYLLLADGKTRKLEQPKRKKRKHTQFAARFDCRVAEKIRSGEKITNSELRRTLAVFGGDGNPDQEG
jgi:ribosomal protein L14E/L6E/L27E